jgi:hypothetical protein
MFGPTGKEVTGRWRAIVLITTKRMIQGRYVARMMDLRN